MRGLVRGRGRQKKVNDTHSKHVFQCGLQEIAELFLRDEFEDGGLEGVAASAAEELHDAEGRC